MHDDAIAVFPIRPAQAQAYTRGLYLRIVALQLAAVGLFVGWTLATTPAAHQLSFWWPALVTSAVAGLFLARSAAVAGRRAATYQLTMGPNVLRIVQQGATPTEVFRHDVRRILELPRGLRIVYGNGRLTGVPRVVDGYAEARARLEAWRPIERSRGLGGWLAIAVMLVGIPVGGMALDRVTLTIADVAWAASLVFLISRVSRTSASKKQRAGAYVAFGALFLWALLRLVAVWL